MASLVAVPAGAGQVQAKAQLPWLAGDGQKQGGALLRESPWWAKVGDKTYYTPTGPGLSRHVGDYYYALGSRSALTQELEQSRVGGDGRLHIFHLPGGAAALQQGLPSSGGRRGSLSALVQLASGLVVSDTFPEYRASAGYSNPLGTTGQTKEREAAAEITKEVVLSFLSNITLLPGTHGPATRSYDNPSASKATQDYLKAQFKLMGLTPCIHAFKDKGQQYGNVIARIAGQGPDSIVIGAHYDSRPFQGKAPGAEDNGSGVAALLAIARAFTKANVRPEKNVFFVGFAAEEVGMLGSGAFAQELASAGAGLPSECRAAAGSFLQRAGRSAEHRAIVLDEVGWRSPALAKATVNLETYDWNQATGLPELMDHMAHASYDHNGQDLYVVHSNHPFGSDHMSFLSRDIPAVLAINGDDDKYPYYHTSDDTLDNVTPEYAAQISKMVLGAAIRAAGVAA